MGVVDVTGGFPEGGAWVEGAVASGFAAEVVACLLARRLPKLMPAFTVEQRVEVAAFHRAVARAADRYRARPVSPGRNGETPVTEVVLSSRRDDEISTSEAAALLGVGVRRVQQYAKAGMGRRVGRLWLLDRGEVEAAAAARRSA